MNFTDSVITYCHENIKAVFHELFDEALKRYNDKQTRADRKIEDYYEKIRSSKQEKPFHEIILQVGNKDDMSADSEDGQLAAAVLDEYMKCFQERNPQLRVFSAHLHMDEATPHLHIDFVPFIAGSKRGLDTRVSLKQALAAQGFKGGTRGDTEWNQWVRSEKEQLAAVMERHGIEWEDKGTHEKHLSVLNYKKEQRIIEQFEASVRQREENYKKNLPNLNKKIQDIEKELERAKKIKDDLYSLNIIPSKYRNIGCAYFIYDYFSTSSTPLNSVFLHSDLDKIQSQLDTVIKNQENSMLQQAIIISQNEELIAQNQRLFEELSDMNRSVNSGLGNINATLGTINENSIETSKWARIAALNAETCAWISFSDYIKG